MRMPDEELRKIKKIQKRRDGKCADSLVSDYYDEIYVYAYKQTLNKETALDLTQDIFIAALRSIDKYNPEKASFRTWLYRISVNKIIDFKRRSRHDMIALDEVEIPVEIDYQALVENKELFSAIDKYLSGLPFERQEIFRLKVFAEYTFAQIAGMLQKPESSVKTAYYRLISELRKEFSDEYTGAG